MTVAEFIAKWKRSDLKERSAAQERFVARFFEAPIQSFRRCQEDEGMLSVFVECSQAFRRETE